MSANQLAEYTLASPTRRQAIIRNAKYAPTFLVMRYSAAKSAIGSFLTDDTRHLSILSDAQNEQLDISKGTGTSFTKNDAALSAEAIANFRSMAGDNLLKNYTFQANTGSSQKLEISNVLVSVNLDLLCFNLSKGGVGGVMIQTSKAVASKSWREDHAKCVASLVWMSANNSLSHHGDVDRKLCLAIDVFAKKVTQTPAHYKRILGNIDASCSEIAMFWPHITPPADLYD